MVDVLHEERHRDQNQPERGKDRKPRHELLYAAVLPANLPEYQKGVYKGSRKDPERHLAEVVAKEGAKNPGGKLAARQLQHNNGDRKDQSGQGQG